MQAEQGHAMQEAKAMGVCIVRMAGRHDLDVSVTSKLPDIGVSIFAVMTRLANEHKAINLSQGFPDFDCDPALVDAVARAMRDGPQPVRADARRAGAARGDRREGASSCYGPRTIRPPKSS